MKTIWFVLVLALSLAAWPVAASAQEGGDENGAGDEGGADDGAGSAGGESAPLELVSLTLTSAIEEGEAPTPSESFSRSDGRIFAIVRVRNPSRTETSVRVAFEKAEGPELQGLELDIPAHARWKTTARTGTARDPGRYRCVVRDADGNVIGQQEFTITE